MDTSNLQHFIDRIFGIKMPGTIGTSTLTQGASAPGTDIVNQLRRDMTQLAALLTNAAPEETVTTAAQAVEGRLLSLQTIGQLSSAECRSLIDELHAVVGA